MRKTLLISILILSACSKLSVSSRSAGETLKEYYAACTSADTARTYALSTSERISDLKSRAGDYFAMCYTQRDSISVLVEKNTSDSSVEVLYTDVVYDRSTGAREDSSVGQCTMKKENDEWKVSACHAPTGVFAGYGTGSKNDLNLGFETVRGAGLPANWYAGGGGKTMADRDDYSASLDSSVVHGGKYSLHLKFVKGSGFGVGTNALSGWLDEARGKTIRFSGWIKTKDVGEYAGLWWRVDGPNGEVYQFNNMSDSMVRGTQDWKKFSFQLPVDRSAANVNFGVLMAGTGEAWFDDLAIDTNGTKWKE